MRWSYIFLAQTHRYLLRTIQQNILTHGGRVTNMCVSKLIFIGSDNGLSPGPRQAIIRTNAGILLIGPPGTNFNEILIKIYKFPFNKNPFKNVVRKMATILSRPQCVNSWRPSDSWVKKAITGQIKAYCQFGGLLFIRQQIQGKLESKYENFYRIKCI